MSSFCLGLFSFLTDSWIHNPHRATFILKTAAGSATPKGFYFSPAWLQCLAASWRTWICKQSRIYRPGLLLSLSECNLILIPVTLCFCASNPPPGMSPCNEWGNTVVHTNLQLMPCWALLPAWILKPKILRSDGLQSSS